MHIAICGGTFDPFHRGHLEPVLAVRGTMNWDRIIYVPAWQQPFKAGRDGASGPHRFAMAVLATREHDDVFVSDFELERGGTSYTVDTLEAMHTLYGGASFDWIIGDDNVAKLPEWRDPERLFAMARFVVLARGVSTVPGTLKPQTVAGRLVFAENRVVPISSTQIRRKVRAGEPIDAFVDPLVSRYIHHNGLYKEDNT
jgi:nicotinate-nucleotide adenylyltransferase